MTTETKCRKEYDRIVRALIAAGKTVTAMESCTAGTVASLLTDTEGASSVFHGSAVTYSNEEKIKAGVPEDVIRSYGVYSEETARAMAEACRSSFGTDLGIGITGSLGRPDPNNPDSVTGEVFAAVTDGKKSCSASFRGIGGKTRKDAKLAAALRISELIVRFL